MKDNPLVYLFGKMWKYSEGNKKNVILYMTMFIIAQIFDDFFMPFLWARVFEVIVTQGITTESTKTLHILMGLFIARQLFVWALHGPARLLEQANAFKVRVNYRKYLLKGILSLPLEWHASHHSGDIIDRLSKGAMAIHDFTEESFRVIYCFVRLIISIAILAYISTESVYIVLTIMLASIIVTIRFDKNIIPKYKEINKNENQIAESITDAITNISTVIILRVEKLVFEAILHKVLKPEQLILHKNRIEESKWFTTSFFCNIMIALFLEVFFQKHFGAGPGVLASTTYLLVNYLNKIGDLFFQFCSMYGDIIRRRSRIMNAEELSLDFPADSFSNHVLPKAWEKLEISNLSFSYEDRVDGVLHLNNVSLSLFKGERIAFIGTRGSGKTTFLKLMRGLYNPQILQLHVDGSHIADGFEGIHSAITLVQQDPEIFSQSIEKNITMGAECTREDILHYTDLACFTDVLGTLPDKEGVDKLDYIIGEKGVNLSGGQKQCLALARGLLACRGKDIILLDEPTSSLDAVTATTVYQNLFREFSDKTIISTVHQLDLLPLFDRICVFSEGQIVAVGTLEELRNTSRHFMSLWEAMRNVSVMSAHSSM